MQKRVQSGVPRRAPWRSLFLSEAGLCGAAVAAGGVSWDATTCCLPTCPVPPPPDTPQRVPSRSRGFNNRSYYSSANYSFYKITNYKTVLRFLFCGILQLSPSYAGHSRPNSSIRFGLTLLWHLPTRGLRWGRIPLTGAQARGGPAVPGSSQAQRPVPPGTRCCALSGSRERAGEGPPDTHTRSFCDRGEGKAMRQRVKLNRAAPRVSSAGDPNPEVSF